VIRLKLHRGIDALRFARVGRVFGPSICVGLVVAMISGCSDLQTSYGPSDGNTGRNSINGFYGFRRVFELAGFETHDVRQLSRRTARNDVLVWTPKTFGSFDNETTMWVDEWLTAGGHTLVFVIPDSGSEVDYWSETRPSSPPAHRLDYRRRQARAINQRLSWRLNRRDVASNGWFMARASASRAETEGLSGPWAEALIDTDDQGAGGSRDQAWRSLQVEYRLSVFDQEANEAVRKQAGKVLAPTGPSSQFYVSDEVPDPGPKQTEFKALLENQSGDALIAEVTSGQWPRSRVLVVAGGSLLTNFALHRSVNRRLAGRIVQATSADRAAAKTGPPHAAFLVTDTTDVPVYQSTEGPPRASGMELLSVWPLSLITIHAAILGMIACLVLLPIFGRPRKPRRKSAADFGDHLNAVTALMTKITPDDYALQRIREYARSGGGKES